MELAYKELSDFSSLFNKENKTKIDTVYGTVSSNGMVKIDGSDLETPYVNTISASEGDRVLLLYKDHSIVTLGNVSDPSVGKDVVKAEVEVLTEENNEKIESVFGARIDELNTVMDTKITESSIAVNNTFMQQIDNGVREAIASADEKLLSYSTTAEMRSEITVSAEQVRSFVTANYTTSADYETDIDNRLSNYSTTLEMNSAINQTANQITLSVSEKYVTNATFDTSNDALRNDAQNKANAALAAANDNLLNNLKNYSTTLEMNSAIDQKSNEINLNVSSKYTTKATFESFEDGVSKDLEAIATRVSTAELKITDEAITSTVRSSTAYKNDLDGKTSNSEIISKINQTAERIQISASKLELTGYLTITGANSKYATIEDAEKALEEAKAASSAASSAASTASSASQKIVSWCSANDSTLIDGSRIYTGSISADKIDINDLFSKYIEASNINITGSSKIGGFSISNKLLASNIITNVSGTSMFSMVTLSPGTDAYSDPGYLQIQRYTGSNSNWITKVTYDGLEVSQGSNSTTIRYSGISCPNGNITSISSTSINTTSLTINGSTTQNGATSRIASGSISSTSVSAGSVVEGYVSFPSGRFSSSPDVVIGFHTNSTASEFGACSCAVYGISTSGFTYKIFNGDTTGRVPALRWIAIQT